MPNRIAPDATPEKGRHQTAWPPSLRRECCYYGDVFLEHDADRLAEVSGLSRREVNRLREKRILALVKPLTDALELSREIAPKLGLDRALELLIRECAEAHAEIVAARPGGYTAFERGKVIKALREARVSIDRMETTILSETKAEG